MNTADEQSRTTPSDGPETSQPEDEGAANTLSSAGALDRTRARTELHLADGRVLRLDSESLRKDFSGEALTPDTRAASDVSLDEAVTIPLIEEHLVLDKRVVETGKVRLRKTVESFEQQLNEPLAVNTFDVETTNMNRVIDAVPDVRQEGETTVYPVVEERLVLSKELILKEEVRVTRRISERRDTQVVTLRREHLTVEREPLAEAEDHPTPGGA